MAADLLFPLESFAPAEAILAKATTRAAGDTEATARVAFLRDGLVQAKL